MHFTKNFRYTATYLLHFLPGATASSSSLLGCDDITCSSNKGSDTCTLTENTFQGVGLTPINNLPKSLSGLSLIKGASIPESVLQDKLALPEKEANASPRTFKSVYYLATPHELIDKQVPITGCVAVFHDTKDLSFRGTSRQSSAGSCDDAVDDDCIDALEALAKKAAGSENMCEALSAALAQKIDACKDLAGEEGTGLGKYTVTSMADVRPISAAENGTSNCWPAEQKTDAISYIVANTQTGTTQYEETIAQLYKVSPVLTVFRTPEGKDAAAGLTCVKLVTKRNKLRPDDEGLANIAEASSILAVVAALTGLMY